MAFLGSVLSKQMDNFVVKVCCVFEILFEAFFGGGEVGSGEVPSFSLHRRKASVHVFFWGEQPVALWSGVSLEGAKQSA